MKLLNNPFILSLLSGLLLTLSFPFTGSLTPLAFIAWVPLFLAASALKEARRAVLKIFLHSFIAFLLYNIGTTWWIWNSTEIGAILAFLVNSLLMSGAFTLGFALFRAPRFSNLHSKDLSLYIGLALVWVIFEFTHFRWELSWPWLTLGHVFSLQPSWVQWYEYTGVLGGTVWVLAVNILVTMMVRSKERNFKILITIASALVVPVVISLFILSRVTLEDPKGKFQNVAIIQPNIDPYTEKFNQSSEVQLNRILSLASPYTQSGTLILGPETALQEVFSKSTFNQTQTSKELNQLVSMHDVRFLLGASTFEWFKESHSSASKPIPNMAGFVEYYNSSLYLSKKQTDVIHKSKLVLGVEKIPFSSMFPFLESLSIDNGGTSGSLGTETEPKVFKDGEKIYAPVVCYESIYGAFVGEQCNKGAELLCIITNDGWWGNTPGHLQHNQFAALRAIETRKYVVRSGNTGISSVWSPDGECQKQLAYGKVGVIAAKVPMLTGKTFYVKYGDYLGWVSLVALVSFFAVFKLTKKTK